MIRNFIRQSRPWTSNIEPVPLGRWKRNDYIDRKVDLANIDHCGDRVCGDLTDNISKKENIDSHNNSLYHKSLKNKSVINNYNYSIQSIVEDYNRRWNENITIKDYLNSFTRRHRGAC